MRAELRRWPLITAGALLATAVMTFVPGASEWGEWTRSGSVGTGPIHVTIVSLFTCHFAHYGAVHWIWNALALGITGVLAEREGRRPLVVATLLSMIAIPLLLWFSTPSLLHYRGASGIASAWFTLAFVQRVRRCETTSMRAVLVIGCAIYLAKLLSEATLGSTWFVGHGSGGFDNVPLAHVVGTACGWLGVHRIDRSGTGASSPDEAGIMWQQRAVRDAGSPLPAYRSPHCTMSSTARP